jgi:hypothetical protein
MKKDDDDEKGLDSEELEDFRNLLKGIIKSATEDAKKYLDEGKIRSKRSNNKMDIDQLKELLEEATKGNIKASVHVLGGLSDMYSMISKISECLPCIGKVFSELHFSRKDDRIAYAGYICLKVLNECMRTDMINYNDNMCNLLGITMDKFCELSKLNESKDFQRK